MSYCAAHRYCPSARLEIFSVKKLNKEYIRRAWVQTDDLRGPRNLGLKVLSPEMRLAITIEMSLLYDDRLRLRNPANLYPLHQSEIWLSARISASLSLVPDPILRR